ncbi:MAG: hypothetical protein ACTSQF_09080 [Candidatus Heimdallarchaeaceae archaeon]
MDIQKLIIGWGFLMLFILIVGLIIRRLDKLNDYPDKLDFVEWYNENKKEILNKVERRSNLYGLDLENEIDKEYEAYLQA